MNQFETATAKMTAKERWQKGIASALGIGVFLVVVVLLFHRKFDEGAIFSLVYGSGAGLIGGVLMFQTVRGTKPALNANVLARQAAHEDQQPERGRRAATNSTALWDRWYMRYQAAILVLGGAYYSYVLGAADHANGLGKYALIGVVLWALWQAREVAGFALALGGIYALFTARWSLYIPGAIILGATIALLALLSRNRKQ